MTESEQNRLSRQTVDIDEQLLLRAKSRWVLDGYRKFGSLVVSLIEDYVRNAGANSDTVRALAGLLAESPESPEAKQLEEIAKLYVHRRQRAATKSADRGAAGRVPARRAHG